MNKRWLITGIGLIVVAVVAVTFFKGKKSRAVSVNRQVETTKSAPFFVKNPKKLYEMASSLEKNHDILKAKELYQELLSNFPDYPRIEEVQHKLEQLNLEVITSNSQSPKTVLCEVQVGDTLGKLAKKYGTTVELIKKKNNLSGDVIRVGQKLYVWTGILNIFVDKSQNILILKDGDQVLKVYTVSTGANNITPVGTFKITSKLVDPVWFKAGAVIPPESPQNVLGSRWMGFDLAGYGIHGTIEPDQMGQQVTAGCVRMRNEDVEQLFDLVPVGTSVTIID